MQARDNFSQLIRTQRYAVIALRSDCMGGIAFMKEKEVGGNLSLGMGFVTIEGGALSGHAVVSVAVTERQVVRNRVRTGKCRQRRADRGSEQNYL